MIKKSAGLFFVLSLVLAICSCAPVTISTSPSGAAVYSADGQTQLGATPFDTSVFLGEKNFTIRQERYFDEPVKLDYDAPRNLDLKLRPTPVLVYSKPDTEIYPSGSETAVGHTPTKVAVNDKASTYTLKTEGYYDQDITVGLESPDPLVVKMARRPIVTISASPEGVEIYENGKLIGTAPVQIEVLSPRTIELHKAGYFAQGGTLTGAPPYEIKATLRPFPVITVTASPDGAQIYRESDLLGKDTAKLAVGEETVLEVRADRYYPQHVTLTPESSAQINVALKAMPYVMINSEPAGAEVMINGESIGMTPVEQLIEKDTSVELRKEGFVNQSAILTGKDASVTLTLKIIHPTAEELAAEAAAKAKAKEAAEKAAAEKAAKQRNLMLAIGGAVAIIIAAVAVVLMKKKKK